MATANEGWNYIGRKTRDLVAACLGIAHSTVTTVMNEYNANHETNFEPTPTQRGQQRTYDPAELELVIRSYIDTQNRLLQPVSD
ncbi:hypothetical protein PR003_g7600 [Phytophthora rubi]|uniref:Uncharacterized protein n=1 Tax=Phytophthora rubi TaxID=129364 RepID=A0A6A3N1V9_9STRA|nr:hypothetical protein PR002_g7548 [Phytophthora rubi]KAE9040284.1 hypothetical protein PR001_g7146 [Phytophthora rubi]KAE9346116.1 hypothetical protein PR003_g7600 [Phytophthora rubi]